MKYHFGTKLVAFLLAAVLLLTVLGSALSILFLESYNLYSQTPAQWEKDRLHSQAMDMAHQVLQRYGQHDPQRILIEGPLLRPGAEHRGHLIVHGDSSSN